MKYIEIKKKTKDELIDMLKNLKKESYNLRFQKKNGQLEKPGRIVGGSIYWNSDGNKVDLAAINPNRSAPVNHIAYLSIKVTM